MFLDNTACNLASLNLMSYYDPESERFDADSFQHACEVTISAQEIIVGNASYPTPAIEKNSHDYRPLGIGFANLGALLMARGLPYDSDSGRDYAAAITALMSGASYAQSARIAAVEGPFAGYAVNREPMLRVMRKHRDAVKKVDAAHVPLELLQAAKKSWQTVVDEGETHGLRNSQISVIAPTGTIAFMMDCDTTGIEPDIALVKYKKLVGGGMIKIVNQTVPEALRRLGYDKDEVQAIVEYIDEHDTIEGAPHLEDEHLAVFDCAFKPASGSRSIHHMGHLKMLGAVQPFVSGAISKTINMPEDSTAEEITEAYVEGWRMGVKAVAVYRDDCKRSQPLSTRRSGVGQGGRGPGSLGPAPQAARRAPGADPQVHHQRPRGLPDGRPVRERAAGRDLPGDGQGGLDHLGSHGRLRDGGLHRPAVRRAVADSGRQVQPHALRAVGLHRQPRDPDRQVDDGLHLPLAGLEVPQPRGPAGGGRRAARRGAGRAAGRQSGHRGAEGGVPLSAGRTELSRLWIDHGAQRHLLQVHELRLDQRLQLTASADES